MTYEEKIIWHDIETEKTDEGYVKVYGELPNDGDELLVATKLGDIDVDVCVKDGDFYDLENYVWNDIVAWAKHPSYKWGEDE